MTPDFLLDNLLGEELAATALLTPDRAPGESAPDRERITREAGPGQALVAVLGLGHAGLPSAITLRRAGFRVVAIDTSARRLEDIRNGRSGLLGADRDELRHQLQDRDFVLTDRIDAVRGAEHVLISMGTTVDRRRHPKPEALQRACAAVVEQARAGQTLVLSSTAHVGATRELLLEPLAQRGLRVGEDVFVAFSPERVDPGADAREQLRTPRIVGAASDACFEHAAELLRNIAPVLQRVASPDTAEMVKLYESTFRAVNIALAFEMADACRAHQLDPIEVTEAAATKPSGFMAHHPSAGVGGHGIGVEPHYLLDELRERGRPAPLAEEALRSIAARPRRVASRAHELLLRSGCQLRDARVLVVGAAYKPGVADCRHSPASEIISRLLADGVQVEYHDPLVASLHVDGEPMYGVDPDPRRDASGFGPEDYDLAVLVTIQPGFDYGWLRRCPQVLDCTYREHAGRRRFLP